MILFFQSPTKTVLAVEAAHAFSPEDVEKLVWAFSEAKPLQLKHWKLVCWSTPGNDHPMDVRNADGNHPKRMGPSPGSLHASTE